jgi:hypothetical protein
MDYIDSYKLDAAVYVSHLIKVLDFVEDSDKRTLIKKEIIKTCELLFDLLQKENK